jgi:O-acetyl-ADP-ribose deacetylase (regulator of RNase III)
VKRYTNFILFSETESRYDILRFTQKLLWVLLLSRAYSSSLRVASENGIKTIAFPNISTGIYGFPKGQASKIAVSTVVDFFNNNKTSVESVIFVCFDKENYELYKELVF